MIFFINRKSPQNEKHPANLINIIRSEATVNCSLLTCGADVSAPYGLFGSCSILLPGAQQLR